jgi:DTW domain-containing protein YfiP
MDEEMDVKAYIAKKEKREEEHRFRDICNRCHRPVKTCLCSTVLPFDTETHFVILMHPKEAKKTRMGTGRLTHLFLRNSEILTGVDFSTDERINSMVADSRFSSFVLYPGENSIDISECKSLFRKTADKRLLIFVIDASWPLAKKILKQSPNLQALRHISFRPKDPSKYTKKQPHEYCLCTLESVSFVLEELEKMGLEKREGNHSAMQATLGKMIRIQSEHIRNSSSLKYRSQDFQGRRKAWPPGKRQRRSVHFDARDDGG